MFRGLIIAMVLMVSSPLVFAQTGPKTEAEDAELKKVYLYQWIDDKGVLHITDRLDKVPKQYRDKATKLEQSQEEKGKQGTPGERVLPERVVPDFSNTGRIDESRKPEWQQRMKDARSRLAALEARYRELDQKRLESFGKWGGIAAGHREGIVEAERIDQEMKQLKTDIDAARKQVEVVIPEEARKAGVPPGWLRE